MLSLFNKVKDKVNDVKETYGCEDFAFHVELNGVKYSQTIKSPGVVKSTDYIKTYGSAVNNVAIVINRILWCAIRIVYVDQEKNSIVVTKICEVYSKDVSAIVELITTALTNIGGHFCINSELFYPDIKCGGAQKYRLISVQKVFVKQRRACDFRLCSFKWWKEPLRDVELLKKAAYHSKIEVKFVHKNDSSVSISMMVERTQSAVYRSTDYYIDGNKMDLHGEVTAEYLKDVNLKDFLYACNDENENKYQLDESDCHCLAEVLWGYCVEYIAPDKPDKKLTKYGKYFNWILPKDKSSTHWKKSMSDINPNDKDDPNILGELGVSKDEIWKKEMKWVDEYQVYYEQECVDRFKVNSNGPPKVSMKRLPENIYENVYDNAYGVMNNNDKDFRNINDTHDYM